MIQKTKWKWLSIILGTLGASLLRNLLSPTKEEIRKNKRSKAEIDKEK